MQTAVNLNSGKIWIFFLNIFDAVNIKQGVSFI